jgi:CheY-like chemotaxis protein
MPDLTPKKILIAEDDKAMRDIVSHKLKSHGYEVTAAENGKQAIELLPAIRPDIMLLDLLMPEVDGFGVLEFIRKNPDKQIAELPVIVLSNLWSNEDILKTQALKASAYLVKAYFTPEEIFAKIEEVLEAEKAKKA